MIPYWLKLQRYAYILFILLSHVREPFVMHQSKKNALHSTSVSGKKIVKKQRHKRTFPRMTLLSCDQSKMITNYDRFGLFLMKVIDQIDKISVAVFLRKNTFSMISQSCIWPTFCFCKCVRKCGCAKFRTSAHPHMCKMCATCMVCLPEFFLEKNLFGNVCGSADVRNFARPHTRTCAKCVQRAWCGCRRLVLQKKFWKCVRKCGCAKFRTSAHPHACEM